MHLSRHLVGGAVLLLACGGAPSTDPGGGGEFGQVGDEPMRWAEVATEPIPPGQLRLSL